MTTLANLSASDLRRAAEIKEKIETLQRQFNACMGGGYTGNGLAPRRTAPAPRQPRGKAKGGKTVAACILEALGKGQTMPKKAITSAASKIRGKRISPALMGFTLAQLKKARKVANPERGQYRKA